jgi:GTP-binding protein
MDSNDLERERGITILAKNTAIQYGDTKINIVDTPGHADFGGEVERILKMVNGVILLVDAAEGPMPQTRFVLSRALELGHRVIVVVNKIDRPDQRIHEVIDEVLELLLDLDASDDQLDSPMLFCSARQGIASYSPDVPGTDLKPLFDTILDYIPAPEADLDQPFQMLVSSIDYNEFVGRIAIGRIERGVLKQNQEIAVCNYHDPDAPAKKAKAVSMYEFDGLGKTAVTESTAGNIIALSGIGDITIGDTICAPECVEPLPFVKISAPTVEMTFSINDSPFAGREGKYVTSRQLRDRLQRETLKDVSLRVSEIEGAMDAFNVAGRGEMSLSILIETMRREGYEFQVSPPRVLYKEIDGKRCEPMERLVVDVPSESVGAVIEKLGSRRGDLLEMTPVGGRMKLEFLVPSRGLFGYRNEFLTDTRGEGIMASVFDSYAPYKGDLNRRNTGSLVSFETGESVSYGLFNAQDRGSLFIGPGVAVYEGMVVGVSPKQEDITVNVCKKKQMTNMRAAGSDEALRLVPPRRLSLEQCLEFLADDELLEVTPENLRIRKTILNHEKRMKASHGGKKK